MSTSDLDRRVSELGKASRRTAWVSLGGLVLIIGALGYAATQLASLERQRSKLEAETDSLQTQRAQLKADISALSEWKQRLSSENERLAATITRTNLVATRPVVLRAENAKYALGVYGLGVSTEQYDKLRLGLERDGYVITRGSLLPNRASWLQPRSTVLYYNDAAAPKARALADTLSARTGTRFGVARGSGLGVVSGQERWSYFIHYVGP